jgi:hypothetical protein
MPDAALLSRLLPPGRRGIDPIAHLGRPHRQGVIGHDASRSIALHNLAPHGATRVDSHQSLDRAHARGLWRAHRRTHRIDWPTIKPRTAAPPPRQSVTPGTRASRTHLGSEGSQVQAKGAQPRRRAACRRHTRVGFRRGPNGRAGTYCAAAASRGWRPARARRSVVTASSAQ